MLRWYGAILLDLTNKLGSSTGVLLQAPKESPTLLMTKQLNTLAIPQHIKHTVPSVTVCMQSPTQQVPGKILFFFLFLCCVHHHHHHHHHVSITLI